MSTTRRAKALTYVTTALTVTGGLCTGQAIRSVLHHGHVWPVLVAIAAVTWTGAWLSLWLPYRAERRKLLRQRALLLDMKRELNAMARDGLLAPEGER